MQDKIKSKENWRALTTQLNAFKAQTSEDVRIPNAAEPPGLPRWKNSLSDSGVKRRVLEWKKKTNNDKKELLAKQNNCLIMPENDYKVRWDCFITIVLLYSCIITNIQMALFEDLS